MNGIKQELYEQCMNYVHNCIDTAQKAIDDAVESANDDTKSSAGDKYETGREMMQQEIDRNRKQLEEAKRQNLVLEQIEHKDHYDVVQVGSLVITNRGKFYIGISRGQIHFEGSHYFAISAISPIGTKLMFQKVGYEFDFNGRTFIIEAIQ
jgi:transcription elongation GreA/GreB family factor